MVVVVLVRVLANDTYVVRHVDRGALVGEVLDHGIVARERVRMKSCDTALLDNDNDMMKRKCRRRRRQWIVCVQLSGSRRNSWYACEYSVGRSRLIVRVIASLVAVVVAVVVVGARTAAWRSTSVSISWSVPQNESPASSTRQRWARIFCGGSWCCIFVARWVAVKQVSSVVAVAVLVLVAATRRECLGCCAVDGQQSGIRRESVVG